MNGLPEDQRDDDEDNSRSSSASRSPSSAEERPSSPEERPDSPQVQVAVDAGHQLMPVVRPYDHQGAAGAAAPLLLRHASVSSLDESSQKYKSSVSTFSDAGHPPYRNLSHPQRALDGFRSMRQNGHLTDVFLVAGDAEIPAHRTLLAACSPYFSAMFTGFNERNREKVTLVNVDPEALRVLVDYVYTAEVEVTEDNVQTLLPAANLLQLTDVRDACCEFLLAQLHPTNCLGIKAFADLHGCLDLLNATNVYIESHFSEVLDCDEFYALSADQVCGLIASDTITVPSEEKVYESVIAWVRQSQQERGKFLAKLMEHVRLPLLSREYLIQRVDCEGLFDTHPECKNFIIEALKFHLAGVSTYQTVPSNLGEASMTSLSALFFNSLRTKPRQPIGLPKVMLAIGGQAPKAIRSVECYDFKTDRWFQISEMPTRRCRCGVVVVHGRVFAVGGFNGSLRVRTVDEYDPVRDVWISAPNMEARRSTLGVATLNDRIYAVGGFDGSTGLNTAEVLDLSLPTKNNPFGFQTPATPGPGTGSLPGREWRPIASMSTRRSSVGVGVLNGFIYAVGGYDGNSRQCLSSVEAYDPDKDVWTRITDMSARRSGAGVGVLGGLLYSVGGHDGPLVRKSVEVFNPDSRGWSAVSDMNFCRRNAGVLSHNGLLYVIGGDDGTSHLNSVEIYNPKTDTWSVSPSLLTIGRSYTGVCVIDKP